MRKPKIEVKFIKTEHEKDHLIYVVKIRNNLKKSIYFRARYKDLRKLSKNIKENLNIVDSYILPAFPPK